MNNAIQKREAEAIYVCPSSQDSEAVGEEIRRKGAAQVRVAVLSFLLQADRVHQPCALIRLFDADRLFRRSVITSYLEYCGKIDRRKAQALRWNTINKTTVPNELCGLFGDN